MSNDDEVTVAIDRLHTLIDKRDIEIERLRAYAKHERSLGAEGPMIELMNAKQEIERLRGLLANSEMTVTEVMADNERLRADIKTVLLQKFEYAREAEDKGAEIERLTAALRERTVLVLR